MFQPEEPDRPRPEDFAAPFFFFSTRDTSRLSYVSPSVQSVLGYDPVKLLGGDYGDLLIPEDPLNADIGSARNGDRIEGVSTKALRAARHANGGRRVLTVHSTLFVEGQLQRMHAIAQDVTEQWLATQHVQKRLSELRERVASLSSRDRTITEAAVQGRSNESIAEELAVSVRTVERARNRLRKSFQVNHVSEIVSLFSECRTLEQIWSLKTNELWHDCHNVRL